MWELILDSYDYHDLLTSCPILLLAKYVYIPPSKSHQIHNQFTLTFITRRWHHQRSLVLPPTSGCWSRWGTEESSSTSIEDGWLNHDTHSFCSNTESHITKDDPRNSLASHTHNACSKVSRWGTVHQISCTSCDHPTGNTSRFPSLLG